MTEAGMVALVEAALGRCCACRAALQGLNHGNVCPRLWHTWRRRTTPGAATFDKQDAAVFVGRDGLGQAGTFKINLADAATCNAMIAAAGPLGYGVAATDLKAPYRAVVSTNAHPAVAELAFYTHWIQQARHE